MGTPTKKPAMRSRPCSPSSATIDLTFNDGTDIATVDVKATSITFAMLATAAWDNDSALAANSSTKLPTQAAVKAYVDALLAAQDAMVFKGVTDCSSNPNYPAASAGHTYKVSVAGKIGGASGIVVEVGDWFICTVDSTSSGNHATVGANWAVIQQNIDGAVTGPASSTSGNVPTFNGTSGKVIQDSGTAFSALTTLTGTQTITNKRITERSSSPSFSATPAINTDNLDYVELSGLSGAITSMTTNLTGTPTAGQILTVRYTDNGTARAITHGASFAAGSVALPTTTILGKWKQVIYQWSTALSKWECNAVQDQI